MKNSIEETKRCIEEIKRVAQNKNMSKIRGSDEGLMVKLDQPNMSTENRQILEKKTTKDIED